MTSLNFLISFLSHFHFNSEMDPPKLVIDSKESYLPLPTPHNPSLATTRSKPRRLVPLILISLSLLSLYHQFGPTLHHTLDHHDHSSHPLRGYLKQFGSLPSERGNFALTSSEAAQKKHRDIYTQFLSVPNAHHARKISES